MNVESPMSAQAAPWYRHRWPWILMSGPAIVVVAGIGTAVLAVRTSDGVVADDYYRQGLAINTVLGREEQAKVLRVGANVQFNEEGTRVRVALAAGAPEPSALKLALIHPTRAGEDQLVSLAPVAPRLFEGQLAVPRAGNWNLQLEDGAATWRLEGTWHTGQAQLRLGETNR